MNKRGNIILDIGIFMVILFVILLVFFVIGQFWNDVHSEILSDSDFQVQDVNETYENVDSWIASLDYLFIFMVFAIIAYLGISAYYIQTHPGYFIIGIFALIILVIIASQIANVFNEFNDEAEFSEESTDYNLGGLVLKGLPIFVLLVGALVIILLYSKFS